MLRRHICLSLILSFTCNFFAYFKFHSDWGRVIGKIEQNELDCRDTAPLKCIQNAFKMIILSWNDVLTSWQYMAVHRNTWLYMAIHGYIWQYMVIKNFYLFGFPSWKSSDPKIIAIKTFLFEISARKKAPENSRWPF